MLAVTAPFWLQGFFRDRLFSSSAFQMDLIANTIVVLTCVQQWKDVFPFPRICRPPANAIKTTTSPKLSAWKLPLNRDRELRLVEIFRSAFEIRARSLLYRHAVFWLNLINWSGVALMEFASEDKPVSRDFWFHFVLFSALKRSPCTSHSLLQQRQNYSCGDSA